MNFINFRGLGKAESELLSNFEFETLLRQAAAAKRSTKGASRWRAYESLKRRLDQICGWSSRDPQYGPEHWEAGIRMLARVMGV